MAEKQSTRMPADMSRINLEKEDEVAFWAERFGINTITLQQAVKTVGPNVTDVGLHLHRRRTPK